MTPKRRLSITTLILLGYAAMLAALAGLGWFAADNMQQLRRITRDLYEHPFTVSNAAADLKTSLYQLRNQVVRAVLIHDDLDLLIHDERESARSANLNLAVIRANFLGDMDRVRELEGILARWQATRDEIFAALRRGDQAAAERLVRGVGTNRFTEAMNLADYILAFARDRARRFDAEAEAESAHIIRDTYALIGLLAAVTLAGAVVVLGRVRYLQRELDRQASLDFLTGVPNRRHFMIQAEREFRRSRRQDRPLALASVDLDQFKSINDRHGHPAGDRVLQRFCAICQQTLRATDLLGRIGGEEFAILLPDTGALEAREVAERVRRAIAAAAPAEAVAFSASFGVAAMQDGDVDLDALLRRADAALYLAKDRGRNRVEEDVSA